MPENDPSIPDDSDLYRRIHPEQVVWDDNTGRLRPTTAAFRDLEMSVNLGDDLAREGLSPDFAVRNHPRHHLAALTAGLARTEDQAVYRDHLPDDPTHGGVAGPKPKPRRTRFANSSRWAVLREAELSEDLREHLPDVTAQPDPGATPNQNRVLGRLIRLWRSAWRRLTH